MKKMQAPFKNRKGIYEIHDIPERRVDALKKQGWYFVGEKIFVMDGEWFSIRKEIKDLLGKTPKSKKHAIEMLKEAGYKVE